MSNQRIYRTHCFLAAVTYFQDTFFMTPRPLQFSASACVLVATLAVTLSGSLAGCVTPPPEPPPAAPAPVAPTPAPAPAVSAPPPAPAPTAGNPALRDGVAAFNAGDYKRAESKLLESQKLGLTDRADQLQAHKTKAFLYCVTRRTALCEKSFADAFAVDKTFDLTRAERGHPVWGPAFSKVKAKQPK